MGVGLQLPFPRSAGSGKSERVFLCCRTAGRLAALSELFIISAATLTGCYDSQWGQEKVAQQQNAEVGRDGVEAHRVHDPGTRFPGLLVQLVRALPGEEKRNAGSVRPLDSRKT